MANLASALIRDSAGSAHADTIPAFGMQADHADVAIDTLSGTDWDAAMCAFSDIHYEQTALFADSGKREVTSHLILKKDGQPVAGARLGLTTLPPLGRGLALLRFGPFWRHADEANDPDCYRAILSALIAEYCTRRHLYLVIRPRPHPDFYPMEAAMLEEAGFTRANTSMLDRYFVDLALDDDAQMKSLHQKWRAKLRAGLAHGLDIRIANDATAIARFQTLFGEMVDRKHLVYAGMDHVEHLSQMARLPPQMRLQIAIASDHEGPVGGLAFAVVGDIAYYVFGASSQRGFDKNAGYVLQWHVIRHLHAAGTARWYELGGPGDPGIRQFKRHLAGKNGLLLPVQEFHYCRDPLSRLAVHGMFAMRDLRNRIQRWHRGT